MAASKYLRNKLTDVKRGTPYSWPASLEWRLLTVAPNSADAATELAAVDYTPITIAENSTLWSATQGAGTTAASTGTSGESSNNADIEFSAAISTDWLAIVAIGAYDGSDNLIEWFPTTDSLGTPITRNFYIGDPVVISAGALKRQIKNPVA